jgi:hypothetical protein
LTIQASIQPYASWHIEKLESTFRDYRDMIRDAGIAGIGPVDMHYFAQNLELIGRYIADSKARQRPEPYNLAVNMLQLDIESLITSIGV